MADHILSYTGAEIDRRLASTTIGAKWHELKTSIARNPALRVDDFLVNTTSNQLSAGIDNTVIRPGEVLPVLTVDAQGKFTVGNIINLASHEPNIVAAYDSTVDTTTFTTDSVVRLTSTGAQTITLTSGWNGSRYRPDGTTLVFIHDGSGIKTFAPASGITLISRNNMLRMDTQYSVVTAFYRGYSQWLLRGDLV